MRASRRRSCRASSARRSARPASLPPDPSGAAGPTQFILAANGRIRSFCEGDGGGRRRPQSLDQRVLHAGAHRREHVRAEGQVRPARRPLVHHRGDRRASGPHRHRVEQRLDDHRGDGLELLRVRQLVSGRGTCAVDSPTFGLDTAALYIGVVQFCDPGGAYAGTSGFVVRKTSVIDFATIAVTPFHDLTGSSAGAGPFAPQGVDNDDPASGDGYFIGVDNASLGTLMLRRVSNPGGTPTISGNISIAVPRPLRRSPCGTSGISAATNGQLDGGDDRLTSASLVNGRLWTAQTIGVTHTGAGERIGEPQRRALVRDRIGDDDALGRAVGHALLQYRFAAASTSATTGCRRSRPRRRAHGHRVQRRRHERVHQRRRRRALLGRRGRHAARAAALHDVRGGLQPAGRSRARRRAAGAGAASRPRLSTAATARRSGRCSSSPTRPTLTALPVGRTVGLGAADAGQRHAVASSRAAWRRSTCR